jgi:hypothetical protein
MPEFTREELYDLVWSEPIKTLATRFDISDVAFAKTCQKTDIPVPERGYWAKLKAGKPVFKAQLPPRGIGASGTVEVAKGHPSHWAYNPITLDDPEPIKSVFPDDMLEILAKARVLVGKVTVPKHLDKFHPAVGKLLEADAVRIKAVSASKYVWDKPLFESIFEKRRLRILNALFLSLQRAGAKPSLSGKEGRDIGIVVGSQRFSLTLDRLGAPRDYRSVTARTERGSDIMELGIPAGSDGKSFRFVWRDQPGNSIERQMTEIVIELIVEGERQYRRSALDRYEWKLERRQQLREEAKRRQEALEKANHERRIRREKERVQGLLRQAVDFRKANDIRSFVETVKSSKHGGSIDSSVLDEWIAWASAEANRIDPTKNGQLLAHMNDTRREAELIDDADFEYRE